MIFNYQKPPDEFTSKTMGELLRELYSWWLDDKDQATFNLIHRYWKILPYKLIRKYNELDEKRKKQRSPHFIDLIYTRNPFLEMIPKDQSSYGGYIFYTFPLPYGCDNPEDE